MSKNYNMLRCRVCDEQLRTVRSHTDPRQPIIWREKHCPRCDERYYTAETFVDSPKGMSESQYLKLLKRLDRS